MEFCPNCEMAMRIKTRKGKQYRICRYCGYRKEVTSGTLGFSIPKDDRPSTIEIAKEEVSSQRKTKLSCKKCHRRKVYSIGTETVSLVRNYTTFVLYRCFSCGFRWREEIA
ncbi:MAG: hypothetical protein ACTSRC_11890 [Candidatus Helarchaeota archaeon]